MSALSVRRIWKWAGAAALSFGCGHAMTPDGGAAGAAGAGAMSGGDQNTGGAFAPSAGSSSVGGRADVVDHAGSGGQSGSDGGADAAGGSAGEAGQSCGDDARLCAACDPTSLTWSCAPATITGACCDANSFQQPQCDDSCVLEADPNGSGCEVAGQTKAVPVVEGISAHCSGGLFACYVSTCTCGCAAGPKGGVPGLSTQCKPTLFANTLHYPESITLHGEFVYWTVYGNCPLGSDLAHGSGKVMGARRGNGAATMAISNLPCPFGIAAADDDLYWTNQPGYAQGSVWTAKKDGTGVRVFADGLRSPYTIRADESFVYWAEQHGVYKKSRMGDEAPQLVVAVDQLDSNVTSAFVIDDRYVYWLDQRSFGNGGIFRVSKAGGAPEHLAADELVEEIALSSAGLFWIDEVGYPKYTLSFLASGAQTPTVLTELPVRPAALSAQGDTAYWVEGKADAPGAIHGMRVGGAQPFIISDAEPQPRAIAADADYIFWANQNYPEAAGNDGEIRRVCRP